MAEEKEAPKRVSRRQFVKGAAVGGAGVAAAGVLASCAPAATPAPAATCPPAPTCPPAADCPPCLTPWIPSTWDEEADVVVVGAGGAGLCASIQAADAGASVIALEKTSTPLSSSTAICSASFGVCQNELQKAEGIIDSPDIFYEDIMRTGGYVNDPDLVRLYVDNCLDTYNWLLSLGWVEVGQLSQPAGASVLRNVSMAPPADFVNLLTEVAEAKGVRILLNTSGERLVADYEDQVLGVKVLDTESGTERFVRAKKAVVISSGGFGRDAALLEQCHQGLSKTFAAAGPEIKGDGIRMGWSLGSGIRDMIYTKPTFGTHVSGMTTGVRVSVNAFHKGAIIVNREGKRFVDESLSYKESGIAALAQTDGVGFQILDQRMYDAANPKASATELFVQANTIEDLASDIGIPPETLKETVDSYNGYVDVGLDREFGRTELAKFGGKPFVKIDTPPFYAYESVGAVLGTYCGLTANKDLQVVDVYGEVIPRLYAAGEVVGGLEGAGYISGTALGNALVFGRIAGKNAAAEEPWE